MHLVLEAVNLSNSLRVTTTPYILDTYSDGIQLTLEIERRPREIEWQSTEEYTDLVEGDVLYLHATFRDVVREELCELYNKYPRILVRHY